MFLQASSSSLNLPYRIKYFSFFKHAQKEYIRNKNIRKWQSMSAWISKIAKITENDNWNNLHRLWHLNGCQTEVEPDKRHLVYYEHWEWGQRSNEQWKNPQQRKHLQSKKNIPFDLMNVHCTKSYHRIDSGAVQEKIRKRTLNRVANITENLNMQITTRKSNKYDKWKPKNTQLVDTNYLFWMPKKEDNSFLPS